MTLVITTASKHGISVLGDGAISRKDVDGTVTVLPERATKIFYAPAANVALAFWGMTKLANGELGDFAKEFVAREVNAPRPLKEVAEALASQLTDAIRPLHTGSKTWADLRRGVHVSGYVRGQPYIYHVHMGTPHHCKPPEAHEDFPTIHGRGRAKYVKFLERGGYARVFNGFSDLFDVVDRAAASLRRYLESEFDVLIPAPTIGGQVAFERAIARLSADMLLSADRTPSVGTDFDVIAFNAAGRIPESELTPSGGPLRRRAASPGTTMTTTSAILFGTSSLATPPRRRR